MFTNCIVGCSISDRMTATFVVDAIANEAARSCDVTGHLVPADREHQFR